MLKDKYARLLQLGEELGIQNGYVDEADGKLKVGGTARYQYDADQLWDCIKQHDDWESEVEAKIEVENSEIYGIYTVQSGDTLSKLSKQLFGNPMRYMEIFEINKDQLNDPNMIRVGQQLKIPKRS